MFPDNYHRIWDTAEHADLREMAREFMANEIVPHHDRCAANHRVDRELRNKAGENGLLLISVPEEYGGGGAECSHEAAILYEQGVATDDASGYSIHLTNVDHHTRA